MKRNNSILDSWIRDFGLESPEDGSICFKAIIQYETKGHFKQLESEVHVVHVKNKDLTVFYLLEPDIVQQDIPEMLYFDTTHFIYHSQMAMEINDNGPDGKYRMTITPVERVCGDATKNELHAKMYN